MDYLFGSGSLIRWSLDVVHASGIVLAVADPGCRPWLQKQTWWLVDVGLGSIAEKKVLRTHAQRGISCETGETARVELKES